MISVSMKRVLVALPLLAGFATVGYFVQPLFADTFECCNNLTYADGCNWCISEDGNYYNVGINPVYRCAEYINPVSCYESQYICAEGEFQRYDNENCFYILLWWGPNDPPEPPSDYISVVTVGCPQDSCD